LKNFMVNKNHPYWRAIYVRLNDRLNQHECNHDVTITTQILKSLPGVDVGGTLKLFRDEWAGFCDCGIYFHAFKDEPKLQQADY